MTAVPQNSWTEAHRRRFSKSFALLPACEIERGGTWADLGCGRGIFSGALAHLLGANGRVLALDLAEGALHELQRQAHGSNWLARIQPIQADIRNPLPCHRLEGMVAANLLHFLRQDQKAAVLCALPRHLKAAGSLIVVEYNSRRSNPAVPYPLTADGWLQLLEDCGWLQPNVKARVRSSFLGEMVAIQAFTG